MAYENANYEAATAYNPKHLVAGGEPTTRKVTIEAGENLVAGTVLGALLEAADLTVTTGTPISGTGGTVGDGALGAWTADAGAQVGTWVLTCTVAGATGKFEVKRPDGTVDGVATVASAYNGGINGTIADGAADWAVGDVIPMVVAATLSTLTYKKSLSAATDGSQTPDLILAQDCDASSADTEAVAYESGKFVGSALTLGTGHTVASIRAGLRAKGIMIDD
jgi:hypothetical protein